MRNRLITASLALSAAVEVFSAALVQASPPAQQPQQNAAKSIKDPNEIVCEKQEQLGSRIASQRVCKTRAEWAEERRLNRQDIEKVQTQRDMSH